MDATTERVVDFAMRAEFSALPQSAVHACKRRLVDAFSCAMAAYDEPLPVMARAMARRQSGDPPASVWGCDWKSTPEAAAFANGVALRDQDMMDAYLGKTRGHPSDVIAGILTAAEVARADGPSAINAIVLAYDVFCTFCDSVDVHARGWDQPVAGVIACAVGAGRLLGLNREQMGHAFALALTPNMALFRTRAGEMSQWKVCASANGSRNAVFAVLLARDGCTGPDRIIEGRHGLWDAIGRFDWQPRVGAGMPHYVERTHMKCFPVAYHAQPVVWAALAVRDGLALDDIAEVRIDTYRLAVEMTGKEEVCWAPRTREMAVHSAPYVLAVALLDGEVSSASFEQARLDDHAIGRLMRKVEVFEAPELSARYPEAAPCRLTITLSSGRVILSEVTHPKGHAANPLIDIELDDKFRRAFRGHGDEVRCEAALQGLWQFDRCASVTHTLSLFARA
ncbi:MAG: MmgE/PrpD family protein [Burkholderiales bacterium]|nr:MmgE/PrpD family protein [Burkholderiales bacterium]